jgi:hypothetical protein
VTIWSKGLVITKDKLSTVLKMCHNSSGHQGVNKTIIRKYKKMKVNHGGEVWHVLNICVFLIAIKLNKPN